MQPAAPAGVSCGAAARAHQMHTALGIPWRVRPQRNSDRSHLGVLTNSVNLIAWFAEHRDSALHKLTHSASPSAKNGAPEKSGRRFHVSHCPATSSQGGNRTPDTRIFSPLLYQLSYLAKPINLRAHPRTINPQPPSQPVPAPDWLKGRANRHGATSTHSPACRTGRTPAPTPPRAAPHTEP